MADVEQLKRLKRGSEEWNQYRLMNPQQPIELEGVDLVRAQLFNVSLVRANLVKANLFESNLEGANLVKANLFEINLEGANLEGANLEGADLRGANLKGANLRGANLFSVNLEEADLREATLRKATFRKANLFKANLVGANLGDAKLREAYLKGAKLQGAHLEGAKLRGADLGEADLTRAHLEGAHLEGAHLEKAKLREADLRRAYLEEAHLGKADLRGAHLQGAHLKKADLSGAKLREADLREANCVRTQALATNFEAARFTGACLKDWNTNRLTNLEAATADYIYSGYENGEFAERRPHSGNFTSGEFATLFKQALDTLDLIFVDGIDWQAFFTSFQNLRQRYSDADLNIQAIEKKGGSFVVRLEMSEAMDKPEIEKAAKGSYEQQLKLIEAHYQAQLQAKDAEIESHKRESANMLEITKLLASKPITIETKAMSNSDQFTTHLAGAKIGNYANKLADNSQQIYNAAQEQSLAEAALEIQTLLYQLSETYPTENVIQRAQLATVAAEQAKANLNLWQRIVSAIDAGTIGAVGEMLSHPVATFFIDAAKDLAETKPQS